MCPVGSQNEEREKKTNQRDLETGGHRPYQPQCASQQHVEGGPQALSATECSGQQWQPREESSLSGWGLDGTERGGGRGPPWSRSCTSGQTRTSGHDLTGPVAGTAAHPACAGAAGTHGPGALPTTRGGHALGRGQRSRCCGALPNPLGSSCSPGCKTAFPCRPTTLWGPGCCQLGPHSKEASSSRKLEDPRKQCPVDEQWDVLIKASLTPQDGTPALPPTEPQWAGSPAEALIH